MREPSGPTSRAVAESDRASGPSYRLAQSSDPSLASYATVAKSLTASPIPLSPVTKTVLPSGLVPTSAGESRPLAGPLYVAIQSRWTAGAEPAGEDAITTNAINTKEAPYRSTLRSRPPFIFKPSRVLAEILHRAAVFVNA